MFIVTTCTLIQVLQEWPCMVKLSWLPLEQQKDSVSCGNVKAPQCVHSTLRRNCLGDNQGLYIKPGGLLALRGGSRGVFGVSRPPSEIY